MVISGYSTALFSTWFHIPEWNLMFDCGDGSSAFLGLKSGNVKHIFVTHADRDHINGLFQFLQLNARDGLPNIYYPANSGSLPAIREFLAQFDPHTTTATWHPIRPGDMVEIKPGIFVKALPNRHIAITDGQVKSLSYIVEKHTQKLRSEFQNLSGADIAAKRLSGMADELFDTRVAKILGLSGDTPSDDLSIWKDTEILIHEATFLDASQITIKGNKHSSLDQVLSQVPNLNIQNLILTHFSSRYSREEVVQAVRKGIMDNDLSIPIHTLLPCEYRSNLLAE